MPFVQGKFDEDFAGIHYEDSKEAISDEDGEAAISDEDSEATISDLEFPPVESQDSGLVPDLAFPPVKVPDSGIIDLEFPDDNTVAVQQPLVDENESVGVLSRIRGWLGKE
jgi:hypothetical protein